MTAAPTANERPRRIQLRRAKGWRMPPNTVKVDRTTKWGNPFIVGEHGTRDKCVELFEFLLAGYRCISLGNVNEQESFMDNVKNIRQLKGKNLACWCSLSDACHADVLLKLANK